jgi:hypothetical protein
MKPLIFFAHGGGWELFAFILAMEGAPWIFAVASVRRGITKKKPRWVGVVYGGLASAIAASFLWMASPFNWASIWAYIVAVPIALGVVGMILNCGGTEPRKAKAPEPTKAAHL